MTPEAMLFAWDPVSHQTLWQAVPVPSAPTIAGGTLVEFDLEHRKVLHRYRIAPGPDESRYVNRPAAR